MITKSVRDINVGTFGCLEIKLPVVTYGSGPPKLSLVSGIHGNEVAGLFVIEQFLRALPEFRGTIQVLPSAYPLAQALEMRLSPQDFKDLNRIFPGHAHKELPERIAWNILEVLADSDLVIDFHSFGLKNPIMAILMGCGSAEVQARSRELIQAFRPEMIWFLDVVQGPDREYRGSLGPTLSMRDIPNFAVEMPMNYRMSDSHLESAVNGLKAVLGKLDMIESDDTAVHPVPMFTREEYCAESSGLFYPESDIMRPVSKGQQVGSLMVLPDFQAQPVKAPVDGMLLQIHERGFVTTGTALLAMGFEVEDQ